MSHLFTEAKFITTMDVFIYGCVDTILNHFLASDLPIANSMEKFIPRALIEECKEKRSDFFSLELSILTYTLDLPKKKADYIIDNISNISDSLTCILQHILVQFSELFFSCGQDMEYFSQEIEKDIVLKQLVENIGLKILF